MIVCFFLSKTPGGHAIFFRCIWVAIPVDWVILYWCACGADSRRTYGHVTSKISRMHRLPNFLTHGAPLRAHRARESSSKKKLQNIGVVKAKKTHRQQYSLNDDGKYPKFLVMFLNGVIGYQSPNSQGVARSSSLSPIMELANEKTEGTRLRGNLKANRTIARWRYLTTTTRIHFGFALLFKFVNPAED